jgi:MFS family permease
LSPATGVPDPSPNPPAPAGSTSSTPSTRSIVAALPGGVGVLIVGRGLMGAGAAMILPATLALIPPQFSGKAQLTAFGVWQAVAWGGQAVGDVPEDLDGTAAAVARIWPKIDHT